MRTGIDPKVDYAFKRVFGSDESREILIALLNAVLTGSGVRPVRDVEIRLFAITVEKRICRRGLTQRREDAKH